MKEQIKKKIKSKLEFLHENNFFKNNIIWFAVCNSSYLEFSYYCIYSWLLNKSKNSKFILFFFKDSQTINKKFFNKLINISHNVSVISIDVQKYLNTIKVKDCKEDNLENRYPFFANIRAYILNLLFDKSPNLIYIDCDSIFTNNLEDIQGFFRLNSANFFCLDTKDTSMRYKSGLLSIWMNKISKKNKKVLSAAINKYSDSVIESINEWGSDQIYLNELVNSIDNLYFPLPLKYFNWYCLLETTIYTAKGRSKSSIIYLIMMKIIDFIAIFGINNFSKNIWNILIKLLFKIYSRKKFLKFLKF